MKRKKDLKKKEWWLDDTVEKAIDKAAEKQKKGEEDIHSDDWIIEVNKFFEFKQYIDKNPGMTRYELARRCPLKNDRDFRKAISFLKFTNEIYEDEEGFFYARNRYTLHY